MLKSRYSGFFFRENGVIPSECAAVVLLLKNRPKPRSPSFTTPAPVMNTLAGLMSAREDDMGLTNV